ncbi:MAG: glycoside hydrolase family 9 protein [Solirubrobacterales bacterium]
MRKLTVLATAAALLGPLVAAGTAPALKPAIRVGGPSAPGESKIAVIGSDRHLAGHRFTVRSGGRAVDHGRLRKAPGRSAPWDHAYTADLGSVRDPGSYRVAVGGLRSRPWRVTPSGSRPAIAEMLRYFAANRDGDEPSPVHDPAHLNDAVVHPDSPVAAGQDLDLIGGWMDAGDMIHFTQTTAFSTAMLEASARLSPAAAPALEAEADVGVRWLLAAHPAPGLFVAQVGDERDHDVGFRDPAGDDATAKPGIGTRFAYPEIGGDLGGKAAAALALAYLRTGDETLLDAARDWYAAGKATGRPARPLRRAGYPGYAANFYVAANWKDSMASGAAELFRATCAAGDCDYSYDDDFRTFLSDQRQTGAYAAMGAVDDFASFGEAEVCGAFGGDVSDFSAASRRVACDRLAENGRIAARQARSNAFGMPGYFSWGTTAQNGAAGALAALATASPDGPAAGCRVAAGARDWMFGRNPFGASFIVGYGPRAPRHPHTWASVFGAGVPAGAVVGGPAPRSEVRGQGFRADSPFDSRFASYEDRRVDYVTSEPAIDYTASSILLMAALEGRC